MWWNVYSELSKRMADQFSGVLVQPSKPAVAKPSRSRYLDSMIQQISEDLAQMADAERESLKSKIAEQAREWCLKDISHDLRTPLNAIIGFTQLMENGTFGVVNNPQYLEYLRHIRESGYELLDKVEGLMDSVSHDASEPNHFVTIERRAQPEYKQNFELFKEAVA